MDATFKHASDRKLTFLLYLNEDWKPEDGGELRLYLKENNIDNNDNNDNNNDEKDVSKNDSCNSFVDVAPLANRLLVFQSRTLKHEVLISNVERYSLTMWVY
jgi:SM-20-related protein